jgi:hypothetical protein
MAYLPKSSPTMIPLITDSRYSGLHHERSYLLSALASEESRAEKETSFLETTRAKLKEAREETDHEAIAALRKRIASTVKRLRKCRQSERAMANNLAAVTARMQFLEQNKWRTAQLEYLHETQRSPVDGLPLGLQRMTLESPMSPSYGYSHSPYPPTCYAMSPFNATLPSLPEYPVLQPQGMMSIANAWDTTLPTPYRQDSPMIFGTDMPFDTPPAALSEMWQTSHRLNSTRTGSGMLSDRPRRMSLPNPPTEHNGYRTGSFETSRRRSSRN